MEQQKPNWDGVVAARKSKKVNSSNTGVNAVTAQDYEEFQKHYKFVLPSDNDNKEAASSGANKKWQDRMVENYHQHLYKEFAIVDLSVPGKIGVRFRTKPEVVAGRGFRTCASKQCPTYSSELGGVNQAQQQSLDSELDVPEDLCDYEVPFQYVEHDEAKMELVKVRLCPVCAQALMERDASSNSRRKKSSRPHEKKGNSNNSNNSSDDDGNDSYSSSDDSESTTSSEDDSEEKGSRRKRKRHDRKRKKHKKKRSSDAPQQPSPSAEIGDGSQDTTHHSDSQSSGDEERKRKRRRKERKEKRKRDRKRHRKR